MARYVVSYMVVYTECVEAESPKEAAEKVEKSCPYDIEGSAWVTNENTREEWEI